MLDGRAAPLRVWTVSSRVRGPWWTYARRRGRLHRMLGERGSRSQGEQSSDRRRRSVDAKTLSSALEDRLRQLQHRRLRLHVGELSGPSNVLREGREGGPRRPVHNRLLVTSSCSFTART